MPSPLSAPLLRRMEARDTCPRITAGIPVKTLNTIERMPKTMLITALGSVSGAFWTCETGGMSAPGAGADSGAATASGAPHCGQNGEDVLRETPHLVQTTSPHKFPARSGETAP